MIHINIKDKRILIPLIAIAGIAFIVCTVFLVKFFTSKSKTIDKGNDNLIPQAEKIAGGDVAMHLEDWEAETGLWEIKDGCLVQTKKGLSQTIKYKKDIPQERVSFYVEMKTDQDNTSLGLEFRRDEKEDKVSVSDFMLDVANKKTVIHAQQSYFNASYGLEYTFEKNKWYAVRIDLNGTDVKFYVNGVLVDQRSDIPLKEGFKKVVLKANNANAYFRKFGVYENKERFKTWMDVINASSMIKKGADRFNAKKYEYAYVGLGGTSMQVGPYGFTLPDAPKKQFGSISQNIKSSPLLIYDMWWNGTEKVTPFAISGGYSIDGKFDAGKIVGDNFTQITNIKDGSVNTLLKLNTAKGDVKTDRTLFTTPEGVVVMKVKDDGELPFLFKISAYETRFANVYEKTENSLVATAGLGDKKNSGALAVFVYGDDIKINAVDGTITVNASKNPAYFYLAPGSSLDAGEEGAKFKESAIKKAKTVYDKKYETSHSETLKWWNDFYSKSEIDIPDTGTAKWYARSLFYNAVSLAGADMLPGCYGTNPFGFDGDVCFEFDMMFSHLALLNTNHIELAKPIADWIYKVKDKTAEVASRLDSKYGAGATKYAGLMGYDGTNIQSEGLIRSWNSDYPSLNVANAVLNYSLWTGENIDPALQILKSTIPIVANRLKYFPNYNGYAHSHVWAPVSGNFENYADGDGIQNVAAIWGIKTAQKYNISNKAWDDLLPKILMTKVNDPTLGGKVYTGTAFATENGNAKGVGGPGVQPYYWLNIKDINDETAKPTILNVVRSGNLDYNFNKGWASIMFAKLGEGENALKYARQLLDTDSTLYDDSCMVEIKADEEDFEKSPELGAHGVFNGAVASMLLDGDKENEITVFPAISEDWKAEGVSFKNFRTNGALIVSGSYLNSETTVTIENLSSKPQTRTLYVKVDNGSTKAKIDDKEVNAQRGAFATIQVTLAPNEKKTLKAKASASDEAPKAFNLELPADKSEGVYFDKTAFAWAKSNGAKSYELAVSKNADMSNPVLKKEVVNTAFVFDIGTLEGGTQYFWKITAKAINEKTTESNVFSFTTLGGKLDLFGNIWDKYGNIKEENGALAITIPSGVDDVSNMALTTAKSKNVAVTVKLNFKPNKNYQQAGIIFYDEGVKYIKIDRGFNSDIGSVFELGGQMTSGNGLTTADTINSDDVYLRMVMYEDNVSAYVSADGLKWKKIGKTIAVSFKNQPKIGVFGGSWLGTADTAKALFKDIKVEYDTIKISEEETKIKLFNQIFEMTGDVSKEGNTIRIDVASKSADTTNMALFTPSSENYTVITKVRFKPTKDFLQAGIILYGSGDKYVKFGREYNSAVGRGYEFSGPLISQGMNSDPYSEEIVYLKIKKLNGKIAAYYSADGLNWIQQGKTADLTYRNLQLGLYASSWSAANGTAIFEDFKIDYNTSPFEIASNNVEFAGINFEKTGVVSKSGNNLKIFAGANDVANKVLTTPTSQDFEIKAKLKFKPSAAFQQAGIILYNADDKYIKFTRMCTPETKAIQLTGSKDALSKDGSSTDNIASDTLYMKVIKKGDKLAAFTSENGVEWKQIGGNTTTNIPGNFSVGLFASSWSNNTTDAYFEDFSINYDNISLPIEDLSVFGKKFTFFGGVTSDGNKITINAGGSDTSNTALIDLNNGDFKAVAKIKFNPDQNHLQAGLLMVADDQNYIKLTRAFTADHKLIQFVGANNCLSGISSISDTLTSDTYYVKLVRVGNYLTAAISENATVWNTLGTYKLKDGVTFSKIGLFASSWSNAVKIATVENFTLDYGTFCDWETKGGATLSATNATINITANSNDTANTVLRAYTGSDFDLKIKLNYKPNAAHLQSGIILYMADLKYVKFGRYCNGTNNYFQLASSDGTSITQPKTISDTLGTNVYLRLTRNANSLTAYVSEDGNNWTVVESATTISQSFEPIRIGLFGSSWSAETATVNIEMLQF